MSMKLLNDIKAVRRELQDKVQEIEEMARELNDRMDRIEYRKKPGPKSRRQQEKLANDE